MGDVPILALTERHFRGSIDSNFPRMLFPLERAVLDPGFGYLGG